MSGQAGLAAQAVVLAGLFGLFAVAGGALAAHGLDDPRAVAWMEKASRYAMWHGLALLGLQALGQLTRLKLALFLFGVLLFSGSLTALAFGAPASAALITPFGCTLLLLAWATVLAGALRSLRIRSRSGTSGAPGQPAGPLGAH